jgi:putative ABC transport system substrate-binding protein
MRRRDFIKVIAGSAAALWSLAAHAEQAAREIPKIGVLWHAGSAEEEGEYFTSFQQGFQDLGYIEGQTIVFEYRFAAEQYDRFRSLAAELVALNVDVLVAVTRPATAAAQAATATIPIVFIVVPDPVGSKFADSLARRGKNLTGTRRRWQASRNSKGGCPRAYASSAFDKSERSGC